MEDRIDYTLPLGPIGSALAERSVKRTLQRLFDYRHYILGSDLALQKRLKIKEEKRILISGSSGLIGSALVPFLGVIMSNDGSNDDDGSDSDYASIPSIVRLFRNGQYQKTSKNSITWDPASGKVPVKELEGFNAVIHLAGEKLFGRWNESKKQMIRDSRIKSTQLLCDALSRLKSPPSVLICASAIGYYGNDRGKEILTEQSKPGSGFLSKVCQEWEDACDLASNAGIRVVNMRFGLVLTPRGGFLKKRLGP
jgi:NAD dependent epimerase/dehydratase family enzyme